MVPRFLTLLLLLTAAAPALATPEDEELAYLDRTELGWVPLVGGDTDFGYGAGVMLSLAGFRFPYEPYLYRIEAVSLALFKVDPNGRFIVPFQDYSLKATFPQIVFDPLRLEVGARYTRSSTLLYPGLGNASTVDPELPYGSGFYVRGDPHAWLGLGVQIHGPWQVKVRGTYAYVVIRYDADSRLADDLASTDPFVSSTLHGTENHPLLKLEYSGSYDTRDSEIHPTKGHYHSLTLLHAPAAGTHFPLQWYRTSLTLRLFGSLFKGRLVFAFRAIGDALFGEAPFYELARVGDRWAIGSAFGVRGVPGQRFYGKLKMLGNLETRLMLFRFEAWERRFQVGIAGFADAGRVWSDYRARPELDSGALMFKYGAGGGLRLLQGEVFLVRADIAWSPWASPIGFYFGAGHVF